MSLQEGTIPECLTIGLNHDKPLLHSSLQPQGAAKQMKGHKVSASNKALGKPRKKLGDVAIEETSGKVMVKNTDRV